ncbi:hypothetical protein C4D60_Mb11t23850 [Musa balbisiana]|uniref:Cytochrome P450 71A1 n=1 Tax=Musa balbisiana TaxID=52838 RepID=A0A4V4H5R0_MUSBA|nr:hypothetical protein C4D60_Mb11t23850 [Musa balbisiana]
MEPPASPRPPTSPLGDQVMANQGGHTEPEVLSSASIDSLRAQLLLVCQRTQKKPPCKDPWHAPFPAQASLHRQLPSTRLAPSPLPPRPVAEAWPPHAAALGSGANPRGLVAGWRPRCHAQPRSSLCQPAKVLLNECKDLAFAPYGEHWRQLRKICVVHLLSSTRVQSYRLIREEEVGFMIRKISSRASPTTTSVDMSEILYSLFNDILCRVVSGKFTREEGRNVLFRELIQESSVLLSKLYVGDNFPWLGWLDVLFGSMERTKKNKKRWDDLLDGVIQEHEDRSAKGDDDDDDDDKDFVDVLLSLREDPANHALLTPQTMKALLMDIFSAGSDTSSAILEYAMVELARSPTTMRKLQDEVRGIGFGKELVKEEEANEMMYLKAVIREVFRLHPSVPLLLPRELMEDCRIEGYKIPQKTRVLVNVWTIGRDPKYWEAPQEFKPERFMEGGAVDFKGNDFQFTPFGAGRRICPGMNFAIASLELALANLIYHFDWELPRGLTTPTCVPHHSRPLRLHSQNTSPHAGDVFTSSSMILFVVFAVACPWARATRAQLAAVARVLLAIDHPLCS